MDTNKYLEEINRCIILYGGKSSLLSQLCDVKTYTTFVKRFPNPLKYTNPYS